MVDVPLGLLLVDAVQQLVVPDRAQGGHGEHLGLATGEHAGAVDAGQQGHLGGQGAHVVHAAAVHALLLVQEPAAHHVLLGQVQALVDFGLLVGVLLGEVLVHVLVDGLQALVPHVLVVGVQSGPHSVLGVIPDGLEHLVLRLVGGVGELLLADLGLDILDKLDDFLVCLVAGHDAVVHILVGHLVGAGLDHGDALVGGGHGNGHLADLALLSVGVDDKLPVNQAHGNAGDGALPGDVGDGEGDGGANHGGNLRGVVLVHGHHGADDGHVVAHVLGEQGADGPVDHAAGEGGLLAGAALTAEEGPGDLAHGVELLFIVHRQGEEIDAIPGLGRGCGRHVDHGVPIAHQALAVGQLGHFPSLHHQRPPRQLCFEHSEILEHNRFLSPWHSRQGGYSKGGPCFPRKQAGRVLQLVCL